MCFPHKLEEEKKHLDFDHVFGLISDLLYGVWELVGMEIYLGPDIPGYTAFSPLNIPHSLTNSQIVGWLLMHC